MLISDSENVHSVGRGFVRFLNGHTAVGILLFFRRCVSVLKQTDGNKEKERKCRKLSL